VNENVDTKGRRAGPLYSNGEVSEALRSRTLANPHTKKQTEITGQGNLTDTSSAKRGDFTANLNWGSGDPHD